jgi:hypothetical protein
MGMVIKGTPLRKYHVVFACNQRENDAYIQMANALGITRSELIRKVLENEFQRLTANVINLKEGE